MSAMTVSPAIRPTLAPRRTRPVRAAVRQRPAPQPAVQRPLGQPVVRQHSTPARLTRRGRAVLLTGFVILAAVVLVLGASLASASQVSGTTAPVRVVEVAPGDTLYGIASRVAQPGQVQQMVGEIMQLNALDGVDLVPGQTLAVPRT